MKKIAAFPILLLALLLASCQNNGDIGDLYGLWAVDDVSIDGTRVDDYPYGEVYFKFQGEIVTLAVVDNDAHLERQSFTGTWTRGEGTLTLDFDQYYKDQRPTGQIPAALLIPAQQATTFTLDRDTSSTLILSYLTPADDADPATAAADPTEGASPAIAAADPADAASAYPIASRLIRFTLHKVN